MIPISSLASPDFTKYEPVLIPHNFSTCYTRRGKDIVVIHDYSWVLRDWAELLVFRIISRVIKVIGLDEEEMMTTIRGI